MTQTLTISLTLDVADVLSYTGPTLLPGATVGQPYSFAINVTGGIGPYQFSATGLPAGLSIDSTGTVSGTPTSAGSFSPVVTVTDAGI